jgi:hypothetical protein
VPHPTTLQVRSLVGRHPEKRCTETVRVSDNRPLRRILEIKEQELKEKLRKLQNEHQICMHFRYRVLKTLHYTEINIKLKRGLA